MDLIPWCTGQLIISTIKPRNLLYHEMGITSTVGMEENETLTGMS